ncbi:hypothetical protein HMPREF9089_01244 [Eubacterium brachy ATCC 33089]|nr:hypothetical protein HMPREF9089_01244 [Eubacterium brachy ATCC 33089]
MATEGHKYKKPEKMGILSVSSLKNITAKMLTNSGKWYRVRHKII